MNATRIDRGSTPTTTIYSEDGDLVFERTFDAPRELVWKAWSDPVLAMRWWGPKGFTAPACEIDFRVGGKTLFAMQSPEFNDGRPIWSTGVYREIVPLERIVTTDSFADADGNVVGTSAVASLTLPVGTHTFTLTVGKAGSGSGTVGTAGAGPAALELAGA